MHLAVGQERVLALGADGTCGGSGRPFCRHVRRGSDFARCARAAQHHTGAQPSHRRRAPQQREDGVHTYRIPALATTPKGTLLCVYDMRRRMGRDLQEDIDTGLSRSTDGGRTWESVRVIMDMGQYGGLPQEQNGCSDPGIIVDQQTGEVFCFAVWMNGKPGKHQWTGDGSEPGYEIGKSASS